MVVSYTTTRGVARRIDYSSLPGKYLIRGNGLSERKGDHTPSSHSLIRTREEKNCLLMAWCTWVRKKLMRHEFLNSTYLHFREWRSIVKKSSRYMEIGLNLSKRLHLSLLASHFRVWVHAFVNWLELREGVGDLFEHVTTRLSSESFSEWLGVTRENRRLIAVGTKALLRWNKFFLRRALVGMVAHAKSNLRMKAAYRMVLSRWRRDWLFCFFRLLKKKTDERCALRDMNVRAIIIWTRNLRKKILLVWWDDVHRVAKGAKRKLRNALALVFKHARCASRKMLERWKCAASCSKRISLTVVRAISRHYMKDMRCFLKWWFGYTIAQKRLVIAAAKVIARREINSTAQYFHSLVRLVFKRKRIRTWFYRMDRSTGRAAFSLWHFWKAKCIQSAPKTQVIWPFAERKPLKKLALRTGKRMAMRPWIHHWRRLMEHRRNVGCFVFFRRLREKPRILNNFLKMWGQRTGYRRMIWSVARRIKIRWFAMLGTQTFYIWRRYVSSKFNVKALLHHLGIHRHFHFCGVYFSVWENYTRESKSDELSRLLVAEREKQEIAKSTELSRLLVAEREKQAIAHELAVAREELAASHKEHESTKLRMNALVARLDQASYVYDQLEETRHVVKELQSSNRTSSDEINRLQLEWDVSKAERDEILVELEKTRENCSRVDLELNGMASALKAEKDLTTSLKASLQEKAERDAILVELEKTRQTCSRVDLELKGMASALKAEKDLTSSLKASLQEKAERDAIHVELEKTREKCSRVDLELKGMASALKAEKDLTSSLKASLQKKTDAEQKTIEDLNKKNAGDPTTQIILASVVLDRNQTEKSKNSAKQSKRKSAAGGAAPAPSTYMQPKDIPKKFCNVRPSGVVKGAKSAEGLSANSFKKLLIMGGKDYMAEFRTKFGSSAADIVDTLTKRHAMLNPLLRPEEPYMDVFEETWNPFKPSRDTGRNCGEELVFKLSKELAAKNVLFEDPIFPADETSLFADPAAAGRNASAEQSFRKDQDAFLAGVTGIEWKRPNEWGDTTAKVVMWSGGIDPDDVAQGRLGNCYYLAAIAGCATGGNDVLLKDVCIENFGNVGLYGVKFFINGKWATVIVDDRIPCEKVGSGWKPIFASPKVHSGQTKGEKELWPMIFEKAWAKLHLSYEATAGGLTQDACSYLSGGLTSVRNLERGSDNTDIWDECVALTAADGGDTFAFLSCAVRDDGDPSHLGLITGHAYSILRLVKAKDGHKFVQIRNPWGESEWTGDYCDSSPLWTPALKKELGHDAEEDGAFFMSWEHFVMWFESIEICDATGLMKMTEGELCRVDGFSSHWVSKKTAGGGPSCSTFKYNPTVTITVDKDCQLALTLLQPDVRPMFQPDQEDLQNKMASAYIWPADTPEKDIAQLLAGQGPVCECLPWSRQSTAIVPLKKGVKYNVTGCTFAPGQEGAFTITMCSKGLTVAPKLFETPTPEHAGCMEANWDPYGCCVSCHNTMDGSFYLTSKGPTCPGCATGKPSKAKVWPKPEEAMNNPQLAAVLDDTTLFALDYTTLVAAPQPEKAAAEAKVSAENAPVQLSMMLGLDFSMAGSEGSDIPEKFKRDVAEDLASPLGIPAANLRIKEGSPGCIILDMEVMPDPSAPGTQLLAVKDLAEQAADPSSRLRSGKITSHATGVEVIPPTPQSIEVDRVDLAGLKEMANTVMRHNKILSRKNSELTKEVVALKSMHERLRKDFENILHSHGQGDEKLDAQGHEKLAERQLYSGLVLEIDEERQRAHDLQQRLDQTSYVYDQLEETQHVVKELQSLNRTSSDEINRLQLEWDVSKAERDAILVDLEKTQETCSRVDLELKGMESELKAEKDSTTSLKESLQKRTDEYSALLAWTSKADLELEGLHRQLESKSADLKGMENANISLNELLQTKIDEYSAHESKVDLELVSLQKQLESKSQDMESVIISLEELLQKKIDENSALTVYKSKQDLESKSDIDSKQQVVEMNLRLDMDFQAAGGAGSVQRQHFINDLKQDLADASAMGTSDFNIRKVSPGSGVVDMNAPEKAAQEIIRQSLDTNSRLRAGKVTRYTDEITLPRIMQQLSRAYSLDLLEVGEEMNGAADHEAMDSPLMNQKSSRLRATRSASNPVAASEAGSQPSPKPLQKAATSRPVRAALTSGAPTSSPASAPSSLSPNRSPAARPIGAPNSSPARAPSSLSPSRSLVDAHSAERATSGMNDLVELEDENGQIQLMPRHVAMQMGAQHVGSYFVHPCADVRVPPRALDVIEALQPSDSRRTKSGNGSSSNFSLHLEFLKNEEQTFFLSPKGGSSVCLSTNREGALISLEPALKARIIALEHLLAEKDKVIQNMSSIKVTNGSPNATPRSAEAAGALLEAQKKVRTSEEQQKWLQGNLEQALIDLAGQKEVTDTVMRHNQILSRKNSELTKEVVAKEQRAQDLKSMHERLRKDFENILHSHGQGDEKLDAQGHEKLAERQLYGGLVLEIDEERQRAHDLQQRLDEVNNQLIHSNELLRQQQETGNLERQQMQNEMKDAVDRQQLVIDRLMKILDSHRERRNKLCNGDTNNDEWKQRANSAELKLQESMSKYQRLQIQMTHQEQENARLKQTLDAVLEGSNFHGQSITGDVDEAVLMLKAINGGEHEADKLFEIVMMIRARTRWGCLSRAQESLLKRRTFKLIDSAFASWADQTNERSFENMLGETCRDGLAKGVPVTSSDSSVLIGFSPMTANGQHVQVPSGHMTCKAAGACVGVCICGCGCEIASDMEILPEQPAQIIAKQPCAVSTRSAPVPQPPPHELSVVSPKLSPILKYQAFVTQTQAPETRILEVPLVATAPATPATAPAAALAALSPEQLLCAHVRKEVLRTVGLKLQEKMPPYIVEHGSRLVDVFGVLHTENQLVSAGDKLLYVDGHAVSALGPKALVKLIRGQPKSQVHLVFSSSQNVSLFRITILRHTEPILLLHEHSNA